MRRHRRVMSQMNVVPYIDVMLVLLVIFMVTAPMMQAGVQVDAPDAEAEPLTADNQQEPVTLFVDKEGQYLLDSGETISREEITQYVSAQLGGNKNRPVYVRADGNVEYKYLMNAVVAAQQAGATKIGLLADPVPANP